MLRIKILIACILICILGGGGYILSRQTPPETITIYKATPYEPSPKTEVRNQTPKSDLSNSPLDAFSETASTNDLPEQEEALNIDPVDVTQPLDFSESMGDTEVSTDSPDYGESPFGYGPYPEVPADYPWQPIWTLSDELRAHYSQAHPEGERAIELMQRVGIKLWQSGQKFTGIAYSNGRIYPNFPDTVYVDVQQTDTGASISVTGSFISEEDMELIKNGGTPSGITVLDMSEGIEPFSFLGL